MRWKVILILGRLRCCCGVAATAAATSMSRESVGAGWAEGAKTVGG